MATRKEQKELTANRLRAAALACFAEHGYRQTQITDITKAAGVAAGTFYVHFKGKEELLEQELALFNTGLANKLAHSGALLDKTANKHVGFDAYEPALQQIAGIFLDHWMEHKAFVRAYAEIFIGATTIENLRDGINPPLELFVQHVLQSVTALEPTSPQLHLQTQAILAIWLRLGLQYVFGTDVQKQDVQQILVQGTIGLVRGCTRV